MLTRLTEDRAHSFERESAGTYGYGAGPGSLRRVDCHTCEPDLWRGSASPRATSRRDGPRREVGTIYRVGGGVVGAGLPPGTRPVSVGGDAAGGCSRLGLSPSLPFW